MKYTRINDEVLYTAERVTHLSENDMRELESLAVLNSRKRVRLCTHAAPDSLLHEMFIVHGKDAYVRPHLHKGRDESFHVLSGVADIVIFDDDGTVSESYRVGDYASGHPFYCRMPQGTVHMVIIRSDALVFCEATTGPFDPDDAEFPEWAPEDGAGDVWKYVAEVSQKIEGL